VVIFRLNKRKSIFFGRSFCPKCKHKLFWYDLIPLLSFIILGGKCRYCKKKISWQYFFVEFATGTLFALVAFLNLKDFSLVEVLNLVKLLYFTCVFIVIFVYDLRYYIIPDKIIIWGIAVAFSLNIAFHAIEQNCYSIALDLISSVLCALFFFLLFYLSKGKWIGGGDFKLVLFMGLVLGWPYILIALLVAINTGALVGILLILLGKKTMKSEIPFGTFLSAAAVFVMLFGERILGWYLGVFSL